MKKLIAGALGATLLATQSVAAGAAPAPVERAESPVKEAEGAIGTVWLAAVFAAVGLGIILLVEDNEDDAPTSP